MLLSLQLLHERTCGDITIGDYWGIEKEHPEFYSTKGVSCLLVNTERVSDCGQSLRMSLKPWKVHLDKWLKLIII